MKAILGSRSAEALADASDWQDGLNAVVESRTAQPNLSFFAFTATPKPKTIELFGRPGSGGMPEPFHLYSMRQAIEEGFILDVLGNYTSYNTYYRLVKQAEDDREFPKRRTAVALAKFLTLHEHNVAQKTEVIIEHFRQPGRVPHRRAGQGDGGHQLQAARGALHGGLQALHHRTRLQRRAPAGGVQRHGARPRHW